MALLYVVQTSCNRSSCIVPTRIVWRACNLAPESGRDVTTKRQFQETSDQLAASPFVRLPSTVSTPTTKAEFFERTTAITSSNAARTYSSGERSFIGRDMTVPPRDCTEQLPLRDFQRVSYRARPMHHRSPYVRGARFDKPHTTSELLICYLVADDLSSPSGMMDRITFTGTP